MCLVPAVVGRPVASARTAVRMRGCRVTVSTVAAGAAKVGIVLTSSVPAGRRVANATLVRLQVGR
jgi:beta-lactam-binding protein with PASTA domain